MTGIDDSEDRYDRSKALFARAVKVIPSGIYGSKNPGFMVAGDYPYYMTGAEGCRVRDADGHEYIDYMCGFGSMLLGYGAPAVDGPALERAARGDLLPCPPPEMVELAEILAGTVQGMDWSIFAKNGTDATTLAVSLARVHTGKPVVLVADGAYHGAANWCSSNDWPVLRDKDEVETFPYGDEAALAGLFAAHSGRIAAVVLTPYHHPVMADSVMPSPTWYPAVESLCHQEGALFIMDDVRANLRLSLAGSHAFFGAKPDLVCMGKAVANGHPIAVLMGTDEIKPTAGNFFISGTFWTSTAPFVAALATLRILESYDYVAELEKKGRALAAGLVEAGAREGYGIVMSGPPAIPFMRFEEDPDMFLNQRFAAAMARLGVFLHPHHNWFLSLAHDQAAIAETIEKSALAFRRVRELTGER